MLKKHDVNMLVTSEPFMKEEAIIHFATILEFLNCCSNEAMGGKLWVMWNSQSMFDVVSKSDQMISGWTFSTGKNSGNICVC